MNTLNDFSGPDHAVPHLELCALQRQAYRLGIAGLIPFVSLSAAGFFANPELKLQLVSALIAYGAVIISFLGAYHWSSAVNGVTGDQVARRLTFAVTPALLGWLAILLPQFYGLLLILSGLLTTWFTDIRWNAAHAWYLVLRRRLTLVASASVAIVFLSLLKET